MKIIERGLPFENRTYQIRCGSCKTLFEFGHSEAQHCSDQRDGDYLKIQCPVCSRECYRNTK